MIPALRSVAGKPQVLHYGRQWCGIMATRIIKVLDAGPGLARRRFSDDEKARIVSKAMLPKMTMAEVGRAIDVWSLICRWRRTLMGASGFPGARSLPSPTDFGPVEVAGPVASRLAEPLAAEVVEVIAAFGQCVFSRIEAKGV